MRNESFRASCVAILFMSATFFASLLYLPQFMQKQLGYSPLEAGVGILPFLGRFASSPSSPARSTTGSGAKRSPSSAPPASPSRPFLFSPVDAAPATLADPGMVVLGIGSAASTRPRPPPGSPRSTNRRPASRAESSTCSRSPAARSGSADDDGLLGAGSFVDGIQAGFRLDAALSLVGFLVALFFVGGDSRAAAARASGLRAS
jgi:hypothetical protein